MKKFILIIPCICLLGCSTLQTNGSFDPAKAEALINEDSGFIENGVSTAVQLALYGLVKDPEKKAQISYDLQVGSKALSALIQGGKVDSNSIKTAFKIKEEWAQPLIDSMDLLWRTFYKKAKTNGYVSLINTAAIHVLKGIQDAGVPGVALPALLTDASTLPAQ